MADREQEPQWSEELTEDERERRGQLIRRVDELLHTSILNDADCIAIYGILMKACRREAAEIAEEMMIESLKEEE